MPDPDDPTEPVAPDDVPPTVESSAEPSPRLHGLWGLISPVAAESLTQSPAVAEPCEVDVKPRGLWSVMAAATTEEPIVESPAAAEPEPVSPASSSTIWQTTDGVALIAGGLSIPAAALSLLPGLAATLPAAALGFLAVGLATLVALTPRCSPTTRRRSLLGGGLGGMALLLGPLVFTPWGQAHRDRASVQGTRRHLQQIATGLSAYHRQYAAFPPGGTDWADPATGQRRGGHSWMTALLPHVGAAHVAAQIDFTRPYDDPINRPALGTPIEAFFAAGGDRRLIGNGFAVSHFAGVGSTITTQDGIAAAAGVFGPNSHVSMHDITDGLSQTWIVGELPGGYPPWGDPENYRVVERGLNRDVRGFGNAAGTGALALFADGSVRFLPNRTELEVLRRYSTRNAGDLSIDAPR